MISPSDIVSYQLNDSDTGNYLSADITHIMTSDIVSINYVTQILEIIYQHDITHIMTLLEIIYQRDITHIMTLLEIIYQRDITHIMTLLEIIYQLTSHTL